MTEQDTTKGIWLMVAVALIFALQDAFSRHLAGEYNVLMIIMIRYWFFGAFVIAVATRKAGGAAPRGSHQATHCPSFARADSGGRGVRHGHGFRAAGPDRGACRIRGLPAADCGAVRPDLGRKRRLAALGPQLASGS